MRMLHPDLARPLAPTPLHDVQAYCISDGVPMNNFVVLRGIISGAGWWWVRGAVGKQQGGPGRDV